MSSESGDQPTDAFTAELRAVAHPVRLRILSLLTGAAMTATEVAAELGLTHANASYHLRRLLIRVIPKCSSPVRRGFAVGLVAQEWRSGVCVGDVDFRGSAESERIQVTRNADW